MRMLHDDFSPCSVLFADDVEASLKFVYAPSIEGEYLFCLAGCLVVTYSCGGNPLQTVHCLGHPFLPRCIPLLGYLYIVGHIPCALVIFCLVVEQSLAQRCSPLGVLEVIELIVDGVEDGGRELVPELQVSIDKGLAVLIGRVEQGVENEVVVCSVPVVGHDVRAIQVPHIGHHDFRVVCVVVFGQEVVGSCAW